MRLMKKDKKYQFNVDDSRTIIRLARSGMKAVVWAAIPALYGPAHHNKWLKRKRKMMTRTTDEGKVEMSTLDEMAEFHHISLPNRHACLP